MSLATDWGYPDTSQGLTFAQCLPLMCGEPGSQSEIIACSQAGYAGVFSCAEPPCTTGGISCPQVPSAAPRVTQTQIGTTPTQPKQSGPRLTPQTLVRPLPDITAVLAPVPAACSAWQNFNQAIAENPVVAVAVLAGLYLLLRPRSRR